MAKIPAADILLFCFSAKFCQWIQALPLAEMLKRQFPKIKTAIGGRVQAGDIRPLPPISFFTRCKCQINYSLHK